MANARMCDRCGRCFNPLSETGSMCRFQNPIFQDPADIEVNRVSTRLLPKKPQDIWIDLCPDCTTLFFLFMNPGEKPGSETKRDESPDDLLFGMIHDIVHGTDKASRIWWGDNEEVKTDD